MTFETKEVYNSPNGDRWLLVRESDAVRVFIRHIPNLPSGGRTSDIELGAFLFERSYGPQHVELLRLIGTLVEKQPRTGARDDRLSDLQNEAVPLDEGCE
jgi:hypothetical protein